jgi:hypothetical protein
MDRDKPINIVPFAPEGLPLVRGFAARYWSRPRTDAYYSWRYLESQPFSRMFLAVQEEECLGMVYALRKAYIINGQRTPCLEVFDWHSLPGLKGSGVGIRVMRAMMREPERLIAFGGTADVLKALPAMGWQRIVAARKFELPLAGERLAPGLERRTGIPASWTRRPLDVAVRVWFGPTLRSRPETGYAEAASMLGDDVDALYDDQSHYGVVQRPLPDVLRWCSHSVAANGNFCFLRFLVKGRLVGWTLSRIYNTGTASEGALLDVFAPEPTIELYTWMVSKAVSILSGFGPTLIVARASCPILQAAIKANRFREMPAEVPIFTWPKGLTETLAPVHVTLNHADGPIRPYGPGDASEP